MFEWLQNIADLITYNLLEIDKASKLGEALNFFIYDSVKILLLLVLIITLMGVINTYFPVERVQNFLSRNKLYGFEYFMASAFGVVTPFCSCSSVPLFIGFVKGGIPLGVTFSFLITSPLVNEVAIALFIGIFGLKITLIYVISGVILGMLSGMILDKFNLEPYLTPWIQDLLTKAKREEKKLATEHLSLKDRFPEIWHETTDILKGVVPYVLVGIAIGGLMHGYIPQGFFEEYLSREKWYAVPLSVLMAVPLYSNASGILPVMQVLVAKGIPIGTAIAFMMAVVGLSFPEAMLLKKVMTLKLIAVFFGVVTLNIIISGYLFNMIL